MFTFVSRSPYPCNERVTRSTGRLAGRDPVADNHDAMLRRIESRTKRIAVGVLVFFSVALAMCAPVGILGSSNLVWGEDNQYGIVRVPGAKVVHLPAGDVDVSAAVDIVGKGNETVDLPLPKHLTLALTPVDDVAQAVVKRSIGGSTNADGDGVNTQRRVWEVHVPSAGDFRVKTRGNFLGVGVNPQLWFGHGPPIPGTYVPLIAVVLTFVGWIALYVIQPRLRGRREQTAGPAPPSGDAEASLAELDHLHRTGALSDAEYHAAQRRVIDGG